jgi:hypothetical protein
LLSSLSVLYPCVSWNVSLGFCVRLMCSSYMPLLLQR